MSVCQVCAKEEVTYTVEEIFDYSSGAMWGGGKKAPSIWKCSNGHTWTEEEKP